MSNLGVAKVRYGTLEWQKFDMEPCSGGGSISVAIFALEAPLARIEQELNCRLGGDHRRVPWVVLDGCNGMVLAVLWRLACQQQ